MNAVILGADCGKRLRPLTSHKPKCWLELNDAPVLERQLTNLIKFGIRNAVFVEVYCVGHIFEKTKNKDFGLKIEFHMIQSTIEQTLFILCSWLKGILGATLYIYACTREI